MVELSRNEFRCVDCGEYPKMTRYGYDGVRVECECDSAYISHPETWRAPMSWKYGTRRGEMRVCND